MSEQEVNSLLLLNGIKFKKNHGKIGKLKWIDDRYRR